MLRNCTACGAAHWYPRAICPFCLSEKTELVQASGRGKIYAYSVMRRAPIPYAIGYVTLEEGPSMITNFVDCDFDKLRIGQPVKLVFLRPRAVHRCRCSRRFDRCGLSAARAPGTGRL